MVPANTAYDCVERNFTQLTLGSYTGTDSLANFLKRQQII
jgi:hypothetical protein